MFICDRCKESSTTNVRCNFKVIEKRPKEYIQTVTKKSGEDKEYTKVYKSNGWEVVKEERICQSCIGREIDKELLSLGKDVYESRAIEITPRPKRKSKEESNDQYVIKLPYDVLPSRFFRKLDGLEAWVAGK